jgi:hypothetical protein
MGFQHTRGSEWRNALRIGYYPTKSVKGKTTGEKNSALSKIVKNQNPVTKVMVIITKQNFGQINSMSQIYTKPLQYFIQNP